jgi:NADPH:quinone reductase-like Zn-dependent oxidoreductase/predicted GNAT family acetyltransferase
MRFHQYGDASVIREDAIPQPEPGPHEVLIEVAGTSFNPSDVALRRGLLRAILPVDLPYTLGADVAGTVRQVGAGVRTLAVGDRVIGRLDGGGAAAEYVTAAADTVVIAPTTIPLPHAAALPVAGLTAWQAVFEHARITAGQRVFINGAGGGVGGLAVQLAKHAGARVVATASARSSAVVRQLGADEIVDYRTGSVADRLGDPVDAILNLVPIRESGAAALVSRVRAGGVVVSITEPVAVPGDSTVTAVRFVARNDTGHLAALAGLVDAGVVGVDIAGCRPLRDLAAVHREAEAGQTRGKIILVPGGAPAGSTPEDPGIVVSDVPRAGRYEARVGGALAGFAAYRRSGRMIIFLHTEVDPAYEGHGVGAALVRVSLDEARAKGVPVVPVCPFYAGWIARHPDYQDLVRTTRETP